MNETIMQFKYPDTVVHEYDSWIVLVRPPQVTIGSLVLACKGEYTSLGEVPTNVYAELASINRDIENNLKDIFGFDKINYLLLMMRDKYVHFHVIPRYSSPKEFLGNTYTDNTWPFPPDITNPLKISDKEFNSIVEYIKLNWKVS